MRFITISLLTCHLLTAYGETNEDQTQQIRAENKAAVAAWQLDVSKPYTNSADILIRNGVMANRQTHTVSFWAEATGVSPRDIIEFFLIGEKSGNDYEAIAIALAEPRDIYAGMLFIGMQPGRCVNYEKLQFWPKGERVNLTFDGHRAETLILKDATGKPLDLTGLVFVGSQQVPSEPGETPALAAQVREPHAIAANYNEAESLFGVPHRAAQSAVYSQQTLNPELQFPAGKRIPIEITPEYVNGKQRVRDFDLYISCGTNATPSIMTAGLSLQERNKPPSPTNKSSLPGVLETLSTIRDAGHDPFVTVHIGDDVTLGQLHELAAILQEIDTENGIRVDPPPAGQLYYQAFAPNESFRKREDRMLQPWELDLDFNSEGKLAARLTEIREKWIPQEIKPQLEIEKHTVASPEAMCELLASRKKDCNVILVEAPASLTHKALMEFIGPAYKTHPTVHVFVNP